MKAVAFDPKHERLTSPSFKAGPINFSAAANAAARQQDGRFVWTNESRRSTAKLAELSEQRAKYKMDPDYQYWHEDHAERPKGGKRGPSVDTLYCAYSLYDTATNNKWKAALMEILPQKMHREDVDKKIRGVMVLRQQPEPGR